MEQPNRDGLVRTIARWDLVAMVINAIVGAGIFGLPSEVFGRVGVYSLLAFLVCAGAVALIILCFAEVSSRFSGTGGPYLYAREAFGPLVGFEVGWLMWIARLTAFAANCNLLVAYLTVFVPAVGASPWRTATIVLVVLALTAINVAGVRNATDVGNVLTLAKMTPLVLFVAAGVFFVDPARFTPGPVPAFSEFSVSVLLLVYAFTGFEMAAIPGGELRDPRRDLPRALLTASAVVSVFYIGIQIVAIGTLPELARSTRPLADAGGRMFGAPGAAVIAAGAVVSILGNLNVTLLVAPRVLFAMAERRELPGVLAATHPRFRTPHVAIAATAAIVLILTLTGTFVYAATISVIARLLSYAATSVALVVLRRRPGAPPAAFLAPGGVPIAVVAVLLVAWLLMNSTARQGRDAGIAALAGVIVYAGSRSRQSL
jgi:amino acid transporter